MGLYSLCAKYNMERLLGIVENTGWIALDAVPVRVRRLHFFIDKGGLVLPLGRQIERLHISTA